MRKARLATAGVLTNLAASAASSAASRMRAFSTNGADPRGPRTVEQVMETVRTVWQDRESCKIERWADAESKSKRRRVEFDLLSRLRDEHSARCRRLTC